MLTSRGTGHIEAGNVRVDGKVVQVPETRVSPEQVVTVRAGAKPEALPPSPF